MGRAGVHGTTHLSPSRHHPPSDGGRPGLPSLSVQTPSSAHHEEVPYSSLLPSTQDPYRGETVSSIPPRTRLGQEGVVGSRLPGLRTQDLFSGPRSLPARRPARPNTLSLRTLALTLQTYV